MKNKLILYSLCIFLASAIFSCDFIPGVSYGKPEDHSKFTSSDIILFGQKGIFTLNRLIYRKATGINAFPDGGIPKYVVDKNYIATYDFKTKKIHIIKETNNKHSKWLPRHGQYHIAKTFYDKVIISQGGQIKKDYSSKYHYYWLDMNTGELTTLPLRTELKKRGFDPTNFRIYLINKRGDIVVEVLKEGIHSKNNEIWLRLYTGSYHKIADIVHYYGVKDNMIFFWSKDNKYLSYNLQSKEIQPVDHKKYPVVSNNPKEYLNINVDFRVYYDDGAFYLHEGKNINGKWEYTKLPITPSTVAPISGIRGIK